jgi:hypothetical protein
MEYLYLLVLLSYFLSYLLWFAYIFVSLIEFNLSTLKKIEKLHGINNKINDIEGNEKRIMVAKVAIDVKDKTDL